MVYNYRVCVSAYTVFVHVYINDGHTRLSTVKHRSLILYMIYSKNSRMIVSFINLRLNMYMYIYVAFGNLLLPAELRD